MSDQIVVPQIVSSQVGSFLEDHTVTAPRGPTRLPLWGRTHFSPPGLHAIGYAGERFIAATSMHAPIAAAMTVGRIQPSWFALGRLHKAPLMCSGKRRHEQKTSSPPTTPQPSMCPGGGRSTAPGWPEQARWVAIVQENDGDRDGVEERDRGYCDGEHRAQSQKPARRR